MGTEIDTDKSFPMFIIPTDSTGPGLSSVNLSLFGMLISVYLSPSPYAAINYGFMNSLFAAPLFIVDVMPDFTLVC